MDRMEQTTEKDLTFDDIMAAPDIESGLEPFPTPEWGGRVWLRPLAAAEVIQMRKQRNKDDSMVFWFSRAACDKNGAPLVKGEESLRRLADKSMAPFVRAQTRILQMNGMMTPSKSWEQLQPLLEKAGVDPKIIRQIQTEWDTEGDPKND